MMPLMDRSWIALSIAWLIEFHFILFAERRALPPG